MSEEKKGCFYHFAKWATIITLCLIGAGLLFIFVGPIFLPDPSADESQPPRSAVNTQSAPTSGIDSYLEYWIKKTLDDDFIRIEYIEESDCLEIVGDAHHVMYTNQEYSEEDFFALLVHDVLELCRQSMDEGKLDVSAVNVRLIGGLVDQYGNPVEDATAFVASFTADTIKKINFDGLPLNRFKPLATNWIVHPAFK